jgi:hypothetical protein
MDVNTELSVPESVRITRSGGQIAIVLLPLPRFKRGRLQLGAALLGAFFITGAMAFMFTLLMMISESPVTHLPFLVGGFTFLLLTLFLGFLQNWNREGATIVISDTTLTLIRGGGIPKREWCLSELWLIRVLPANEGETTWDLEIKLRNGKYIPFPRGRQKEELEWVAKLLHGIQPKMPAIRPVLQNAHVSTSKGGDCRVCGVAMEASIVFCSRCRTPHHEECWAYNGMCSTYACREIRFIRDL